MSQPQTPAPTAADVLEQRVAQRAFFHKLANDWNIHPQSEADAVQLLEAAALLEHAHAADREKTASAGNPFLSQALGGLRQALGVGESQAGDYEQRVKQAALQLAADDDDVAGAALQMLDELTRQQ